MSYQIRPKSRKAKSRPSRQSLPETKTLVLSERNREVFFETLIHPPEPNARLRRAFKAADARVFRIIRDAR